MKMEPNDRDFLYEEDLKDESSYVMEEDDPLVQNAMRKRYEVIAEKGDYRLVSDPECRWHVQCISTAAWYTEASGGLFDDSQTRGKYLELVDKYFPEHAEPELLHCTECDALIDRDDFPMDFEDTITLCIECYMKDQ